MSQEREKGTSEANLRVLHGCRHLLRVLVRMDGSHSLANHVALSGEARRAVCERVQAIRSVPGGEEERTNERASGERRGELGDVCSTDHEHRHF